MLPPFPREVELAKSYVAVELGAGERISFVDPSVLGKPVNLMSILAESDSVVRINKGSWISMKRDEAIVLINCMEITDVEVNSGTVRIFATVIPKWVPALFWTRSVTVLGVADAVQDALASYGAAKDSTLSSVLPRYLADSQGNELSDYVRSIWRPDLKLYDVTIQSGELWNLAGNMVKSVNSLTVQGTLIVSDQALLRTWGDVVVEGGRVIVQDNAQVVSEVVA